MSGSKGEEGNRDEGQCREREGERVLEMRTGIGGEYLWNYQETCIGSSRDPMCATLAEILTNKRYED